ncbi:MAG: hypothetical protein ACK4K9_02515 [Bacteroidia bacterium]
MAIGLIFVNIVKLLMNPFADFNINSKTWIYAADRLLNETESKDINKILNEFTLGWKAHELPLKAKAQVFYNAILVIMVDENYNTVSGCGIDKSVSTIKNIGEKYHVNFFNRLLIHILIDDKIKIYNTLQLKYAIRSSEVNSNSLVLNTMVQNKKMFENQLFIKLSESWAGKYLVQTA